MKKINFFNIFLTFQLKILKIPWIFVFGHIGLTKKLYKVQKLRIQFQGMYKLSFFQYPRNCPRIRKIAGPMILIQTHIIKKGNKSDDKRRGNSQSPKTERIAKNLRCLADTLVVYCSPVFWGLLHEWLGLFL